MDDNPIWVSDTDSNKELPLTDEEKKEIAIQGIILNIIEMNINEAKDIIENSNININNPFFDYIYNERKGQVIYNRTLLEWCLLLYKDNSHLNNFNHKKLYNFIYYLIKEKIDLDDTNRQLQNALEIISDSMIDIEFFNKDLISEEKQKMMLEQLSVIDRKLTFLWAHICNVNDIDRKLTFLWAHICNVNERSKVYNYT
jgi:hypothetical protein